MNAKSILLAALVGLGTISFPATADARHKTTRRYYRAYPQHYYHSYRAYPRYYYSRPYYHYYSPSYYYYDPYRYHRGTYFNFQYGPVSVGGWR